MKIIGLTGSVASGKNFVAEIFAKNGAAVFDADSEVHKLLDSDKSTFREIVKYFPEVIIDKKIDRKILGKIVFLDEKKFHILEKILYPKVRKEYKNFLDEALANKAKMVILNVPLLLEKEGYRCDKIISVILPKSLQKKRFLLRAKKNNIANYDQELKNLENKFEQIYQKQISNLERKKKSNFVINNHLSKADTIAQVKKIISEIK